RSSRPCRHARQSRNRKKNPSPSGSPTSESMWWWNECATGTVAHDRCLSPWSHGGVGSIFSSTPNSSPQTSSTIFPPEWSVLLKLLRFASFGQRQHGFDVHFDGSFYHQPGNGRQLIAVRLLADEKSARSARCGF